MEEPPERAAVSVRVTELVPKVTLVVLGVVVKVGLAALTVTCSAGSLLSSAATR